MDRVSGVGGRWSVWSGWRIKLCFAVKEENETRWWTEEYTWTCYNQVLVFTHIDTQRSGMAEAQKKR